MANRQMSPLANLQRQLHPLTLTFALFLLLCCCCILTSGDFSTPTSLLHSQSTIQPNSSHTTTITTPTYKQLVPVVPMVAAILTKSPNNNNATKRQTSEQLVNNWTAAGTKEDLATQTSTLSSISTTAPPTKPTKWSTFTKGEQNSMQYKLSCNPDSMQIEINVSSIQDPVVYLERLKSFQICKPKFQGRVATFTLALDDNFYRCGTTKVHDQHTDTRVYYNRVIVESQTNPRDLRSIYFKCSLPSAHKLLQSAFAGAKDNSKRSKRQSASSNPWLGPTGQLVNFTEIDLPENFMEAEVLDFTDNITASAPYPHLNIRVKRNGQLVNTSLNVAPGTPLEMIIYLDDESRSVYGLLTSFLKVTDTTSRQQEVIVLNGCSIDPYIFSNFETDQGGDEVSAKFRAFKFPESNYVMFIGTVNVCLDKCAGVPCGNDGLVGYGRRRRRRRRSIPAELPKDPNKVFEIEMSTYLQIGYSQAELELKKESLRGSSMATRPESKFDQPPPPQPNSPSKLTDSSASQQFQAYTRNWALGQSPVSSGQIPALLLVSILLNRFAIIN